MKNLVGIAANLPEKTIRTVCLVCLFSLVWSRMVPGCPKCCKCFPDRQHWWTLWSIRMCLSWIPRQMMMLIKGMIIRVTMILVSIFVCFLYVHFCVGGNCGWVFIHACFCNSSGGYVNISVSCQTLQNMTQWRNRQLCCLALCPCFMHYLLISTPCDQIITTWVRLITVFRQTTVFSPTNWAG